MTAAERERFMLEHSRDEERAAQVERLRIRRAQREALRELYDAMLSTIAGNPGSVDRVLEGFAAVRRATRAPRGKGRKT